MSRASSEKLIRAYYTAHGIGDIDGMLKLLADGVIHDPADGARELGKAAFRARYEQARARCQESVADMALMGDKEGRRMAAEFTVMGRHLDSGQGYGMPAGAFFLIDERKILRLTEYRQDKSS